MSTKPATFLRTMRAVLSAFFGVRKGKHLESDAANLKLSHVVMAGIIAALLFVLTLLLVVRLVTSA
ncbi:MAG TPA: DUF2970 domain-containing protein [Burkholderiales bacterium]|jgi:hypothetical protein|nr:DUF2970 domain-containing protein [Burkholderiales bacterium]